MNKLHQGLTIASTIRRNRINLSYLGLNSDVPYPRNRTIMSHSSQASTRVPSHPHTLIERILALDNSSELAQQYTPLIMINPDQTGDSSSYVAVGHAHASLVDSALLHCKNDDGEPIFVKDRLPNGLGIMTDVLQLYMDARIRKDAKQYESHNSSEFNGYDPLELFQKRTVAFEYVTDYLMSTGIISHKHADVYPIYPFVSGEDSVNKKTVLAHVNRSTAPYLGIDSVGVHLNCYVCQHEGEHCGAGSSVNTNKIKGVWLAKRAPTKAHHPNYWDSTVAGGQPADLSLIDNIVKEAQEEAGVPSEWIRESSDTSIFFSDHTNDPLAITTAKPDGTCMKRSLYYSCDLQVPHSWTPTPVDGEVSEFRLYSMKELEEEVRHGDSVRPAIRAVLLDFMIRHEALEGEEETNNLRDAMRRERLLLW
jgi:isopentenyldiphosphate isomerase